MNRTILMGRLTKDPEMRYTPNGVAVTNFTIAVDRKFSKEKEADFINCVAWNKTAEFIAQYFTKGKQILLEGRIQVRSYETDSGEKRWVTEVVAEQVEFCGSKTDNSVQQAKNFANDFGVEIDFTDDDVPF